MEGNMTLTDEQAKAVAGKPDGIRLKDPDTNSEYILVRADLYERLLESQYDDSAWTPEEMQALAWKAGKHAGWDEMSEYDNYPEKP
jgi:hypothetical protein